MEKSRLVEDLNKINRLILLPINRKISLPNSLQTRKLTLFLPLGSN
jgi:hypothetical protein